MIVVMVIFNQQDVIEVRCLNHLTNTEDAIKAFVPVIQYKKCEGSIF